MADTFPDKLSEFNDSLLAAPNDLTRIVLGHFSIEKLLEEVLQITLPHVERLELVRVSFLLKADILIALGIVDHQMRPILARLNSIRNKVAHNPYYSYSETDSAETQRIVRSCRGTLADVNDAKVFDPLIFLCHLCFIIVETGAKGLIRSKTTSMVIGAVIRERIERYGLRSEPDSPVSSEIDQRITDALKHPAAQFPKTTFDPVKD